MAYAQQGSAVLFGTNATSGTPPTFTLYGQAGTTVSGYAAPIVSGANVSHQAANETITNESGEIVAAIAHGEYLECTFDLIPSGADLATARLTSRLPAVGSTMVTAGFDVIPMGPFTDGLNVAGGSAPETSRWIYVGGGSIRLSSEGHATLSLPMKRYPSIVGGTAIVN